MVPTPTRWTALSGRSQPHRVRLPRGHTDHDLIAFVTGEDPAVVFCGDLVEESGDPCIDEQSDLLAWPATLERVLAAGGDGAVYVPGHGALVDATFVRRQAEWLAGLAT